MLQSINNFMKWWNRPNKSAIADFLQSLVVILPIVFVVRTWVYGLYVVPTGSMETTMLVGERFLADKFTYIFSDPKRGDIISFNDPNFEYSQNRFKRLWQFYVWGPQNWTKRVIGIPGDHVQGKIEDGHPVVYLNDKKLDELYLNKYPLVPTMAQGPKSYDPAYSFADQPFYKLNALDVRQAQYIKEMHGIPTQRTPGTPLDSYPDSAGSDVFDVHLEDGQYWAMGDNRLGSWDCRGWKETPDGRHTWKVLPRSWIHGKIVFRILSIDTDDSFVIFDLLSHPISFWKRVRWSRFFQIVR